MKVSAEKIRELVAVSATLALVATVVKGKDSFAATISSGANVGMQPVDGSGRDIAFGTIDAAIKFVGANCDNVAITVTMDVTEAVKLFRKPVYGSLALANAALKTKLQGRLVTITASRAKLAQTKLDYETMGYNTSPVPAVVARYDAVVAQLVNVDANIAYINGVVATL